MRWRICDGRSLVVVQRDCKFSKKKKQPTVLAQSKEQHCHQLFPKVATPDESLVSAETKEASLSLSIDSTANNSMQEGGSSHRDPETRAFEREFYDDFDESVKV